jgi:hypothetical protein
MATWSDYSRFAHPIKASPSANIFLPQLSLDWLERGS